MYNFLQFRTRGKWSDPVVGRNGWLARALTLIGFLLVTSASADAQQGDLVIDISGFTHDNGQAIASLFREGDDIPSKPYARIVAEIHEGKAIALFPSLQHGDYALIVFHDENGNNNLDHNFLGFPAEPMGYSNGFSFSLFSGMPNFKKLRFTFGEGAKPLEIPVD